MFYLLSVFFFIGLLCVAIDFRLMCIDYFIDKVSREKFLKILCALALFPIVRVFTFRGHSRSVSVQNL
jgi:hypothetical protein